MFSRKKKKKKKKKKRSSGGGKPIGQWGGDQNFLNREII